MRDGGSMRKTYHERPTSANASRRRERDKGASLFLDALWTIQAVSPPARFDGSVSRTDPSVGRRRPGTGRARSSNRLQAGRSVIGIGKG
jgi:hypothetical protein